MSHLIFGILGFIWQSYKRVFIQVSLLYIVHKDVIGSLSDTLLALLTSGCTYLWQHFLNRVP